MACAGGAREALKSRPKSMNLTLNSRKGFIRLAIRHGASVIPAISFGENDVYQTVSSYRACSVVRTSLSFLGAFVSYTEPVFLLSFNLK